jgi:hypothetical protein
MAKQMRKRKLPTTDSIQELAKFWDSRDLTDFEHELKEVKEPVFVRSRPVKVHLRATELEAVERIAEDKGVSREELIRGWVRKRLSRRNGARRKTRGSGKGS